jgi:hypothetical protein
MEDEGLPQVTVELKGKEQEKERRLKTGRRAERKFASSKEEMLKKYKAEMD